MGAISLHAVLRLAGCWRAVAPALLGLLSAAVAASETAGAPAEVEQALYAAPTRSDYIGRVLASVEINGVGPYRFILDSGANRSVLSSQLAERLGIVPDANALTEVHGVTGSAEVPMARVAKLQVGEIVMLDQELPVLAGPVFAGADGILGIDGLQHARIDVDFARDRVTIRPSEGRRAPFGYMTVPARLFHQGLLLVEGRVGSVPTQIIIDTGAQHTIGNLQLQEALVRTTRRADRSAATVTGATPGTVSGITHSTPPIAIGEARLTSLPVTFGDLYIFSLWGLTDVPALVIGMDILGTLQRFVVDYARQEFHIKTYSKGQPSIRRCNSAGCATRLPAPSS